VEIFEAKSTIQYINPIWTAGRFAEDAPQKLWLRLPESLRKIALEELSHGNKIQSILENQIDNIVLLSFTKGPLIDRQTGGSFHIHTTHAYGNYCYDDKNATYEDIESGCFLAFCDPDYEHPLDK
jgi:hypothetical protein